MNEKVNLEKCTCCSHHHCRLSDGRFNKWLDDTTVHGVKHVLKGKSPCRRIFWTMIFFISVVGCMYEIVDRFIFFFGNPTSTTISLEYGRNGVPFPAVTVCNLNPVKKSFAMENDLTDVLGLLYHSSKLNYNQTRDILSECENSMNISNISQTCSLHDILYQGQTDLKDFIVQCNFGGDLSSNDYFDCVDQFFPVITNLGLCYTFNGHNDSGRYVKAAGERYGLKIVVNIHQNEYGSSLNGNAGIKMSINSQGSLPDPNEKGIAVPPGRNAFVALRTERTIDNTNKKCQSSEHYFKYFPDHDYSISTCKANAYVNYVGETCHCLHPRAEAAMVSGMEQCTINDTCCLIKSDLIYDPISKCPERDVCDVTSYQPFVSYAQFPSDSFAQEFSEMFNISVDAIYRDILAVTVYFENVAVTKSETSQSYTSSGLLSDIGGQLGLFLGASVISLLEIIMLVFDEAKDRILTRSLKSKVKDFEDGIHDHIPEVTGNETYVHSEIYDMFPDENSVQL